MTDHVGRRRFSSAGRAVRRGSVEGTGLPTLAVVALGVLVLGSISPAIAAVGTQTDWSGGAAEPQVVDVWNRSFASSEGISWLAVPGQITLSGVPLETPEKHLVDDDFVRSSSLEPVDLDGDGDLDLLGTALEDDDLDWWRNDGGSPITWTRFVVTDSLTGSHHADAWDMDLDGDLDIVALGYGHP